jgi:hypothetical protein
MSGVQSEPALAKEVADAEFDRWLSEMGLAEKCDPARLNDEDKRSLAAVKELLVTAIMGGSLVVDGSGCFVFTPTKSADQTPITFWEPTGASYMAMDQAKRGQDVAKTIKFLADITKQSPTRFAKMVNRDLSVCSAIAAIFLA